MSQTKRILVIDDDPDIVLLVRAALGAFGCETHGAENGRAALEAIADVAPDLVILDLMMPEMNGIEFCRTWIEDLGELDTPILMISAVNEKSRLVREFFEMPIATRGFLRKPFDTPELMARVSELLAGKTMEAPAAGPARDDAHSLRPAAARGPQATPVPAPSAPAEPPRAKLARPATPALGSSPVMKDQDKMLELAMELLERRQAESASQQPSEPTPDPFKVPVASAPPPPSEAETKPRHRLRVLCIDDDEDIRMIMRMTLDSIHEVAIAENGMDALHMIDDFEPDFVISDFDMPHLNGVQTIEAIRAHPRFADIPVFILTGNTSQQLPRQVFEAGGNLMLKKPLDPERLIRIIDRFVDEADIRPRTRLARRPQAAAPARAATKPGDPARPARTAGNVRPRIAVVTGDDRAAKFLKDMLEDEVGRLEVVVANEARRALGNLGRWEPDGVLYDPRDRVMDGVAFVQSLRLKRLLDRYEMAFAGREFYDSDRQFSKQTFGREPIKLDQAKPALLEELRAFVEGARRRVTGPKRYTMDELSHQDAEGQRKDRSSKDKLELQREHFRSRFKNIQEFIDKETMSI